MQCLSFINGHLGFIGEVFSAHFSALKCVRVCGGGCNSCTNYSTYIRQPLMLLKAMT